MTRRDSARQSQVTLFLMTAKGHAFLRHVIAHYRSLIACVVVGRDSNIAHDYSADIIALCGKHNIAWRERDDAAAISTPYAMAVSWRWLIPSELGQLIVFHDSILPRYRGFAPLVNALINGEDIIGVTALFATAEYDRGDIIAQAQTRIAYPVTIAEAIDANIKNYLACADMVFAQIAAGRPVRGTPQDHAKASYSLWRDENDYVIDWSASSAFIRRFIDALGAPYRGALTFSAGRPMRIRRAEEVPDVRIENRDCGKVIFSDHGSATIVCGTGLLRITDACWDDESCDSEPLFPLKKFRMRLSNDAGRA